MNDFYVYNTHGLTAAAITAAVEAAQKVIKPDEIKELWLVPYAKSVYVAVGSFPCVRVPHDFGSGARQCQ